MSNQLKFGLLFSFLFYLINFHPIEAVGIYQARNMHDNEHAAWGGNGGSWGNSHSDWYGEYGWPEHRTSYDNNSYSERHRPYYPSRDSYSSSPSDDYSDDSVNGGALYFNLK